MLFVSYHIFLFYSNVDLLMHNKNSRVDFPLVIQSLYNSGSG